MSLERSLEAGLTLAVVIVSLALGAGAQSPRGGTPRVPKPVRGPGRARPPQAAPPAKKAATPGVPEPAARGAESGGSLVPRRAGRPAVVGEGDARSGSAAMELQTGHMGAVWIVGVSPDGKLAASASDDGTVKVWDAAAGALVRTLRVSAVGFRGVAFSPDGKLLATGGENQVQLWEIPRVALRATWNVEGGSIRDIAFAPDGRSVAVLGSDANLNGSMRLYEYPSGRLARSLDPRVVGPYRITFSPDGRWLACTSAERTVKLWDARTGNLRWSVTSEGAVAFSPDSKILASSVSQGVNLWNIETRTLERTLPMSGALYGVAYLPDGRTVFDSSMRWWDTSTGKSVRALPQSGMVAMSLSPDGATLVAATLGGVVWIIDMTRGEVKHRLGDGQHPHSVVAAPQGDLLLSGGSGGAVRLWDLRSGTLVRSLAGLTGEVLSVRFSPDGSLAAAGDTSGSIRLWDVLSGSPLQEIGRHRAAVEALAFSPDGTALASSSLDGSHRVWDLQGQSPPRTLPGKNRSLPGVFPGGLAYSTDGRLLATVAAQDVQLWDTATWQVAQTLRGPAQVSGLREEAQVSSLAFSPDGSTIAVGTWDETVRLWDVKTGQQLRMLTGHRGVVFSLAFSPDGQVLAGGDEYLGVDCWDVRSGELRHKLQGHSGHVRSVCFAPDSRTLISSSADGAIRIWDIAAARPLATFLTPRPPTPAGNPAPPAPPRPAAPVGPVPPGTLQWEVATAGPRETGLLLRDGGDGATERAERSGRPCVGNRPGMQPPSMYLYFQAARAPASGPAYVLVEYFDDLRAGPLGLEYDSRDPQAGVLEGAYAPADDMAGGVRGGSGEWRRAVFRLEQPRWEHRQNLQSDFRLTGGPVWVRSVQVTAAQPADWEALTAAAVSNDYLVLTPEGYYAASPGADRHIQFGLAGLPFPAECFRGRYDRPDLVEQSLAGQKVPAPPPFQGPYPPRLTVLERPAEKLGGEHLQVTVRLEDDSAVLRLACFVNGNRVPAQVQRLPSPAPAKGAGATGDPYTEGGAFRVTVTVPAEAAAVKLALVAYDDDELQSPRQELLFSHTPVVNPAAGRLLGLCVGVSRYRTARLNLKFADQDAASLTQALNTQPGLYKGSAVRDLRNEQATAAGVKAALDALAGQVTKQDTVVLFFSGHGWQAEDGSFYFATHETEPQNLRTTALPWSEVVARLGALSRKGKRVLVLLDACHSGSAASSDQLVRAVLAAEAGVTVLASSRGGEYSFEQQELRHGAFTAALLEALAGKAAPESKTVSLWELRGYVERRVRELTAERQHPQVPYLQDFDTGAPFLVAVKSVQ